MFSVINKPSMLSAVMLNVIMLTAIMPNVVALTTNVLCQKQGKIMYIFFRPTLNNPRIFTDFL
jgi:hypothetical protein